MPFWGQTTQNSSDFAPETGLRFTKRVEALRGLKAFRTAVLFWSQTTSDSSGLSPKRDCSPKSLKGRVLRGGAHNENGDFRKISVHRRVAWCLYSPRRRENQSSQIRPMSWVLPGNGIAGISGIVYQASVLLRNRLVGATTS